MNERQALTAAFSRTYKDADRDRKIILLNEFTNLTGYNRSYASRILRNPPTKKKGPTKRKSRIVYGDDVRRALEKIWTILDFICGQRRLVNDRPVEGIRNRPLDRV